jgi:hypothetical protein
MAMTLCVCKKCGQSFMGGGGFPTTICKACNNPHSEKNKMLARIRELEGEVQKLTKCDCGRNLTTGLCRICDNDE